MGKSEMVRIAIFFKQIFIYEISLYNNFVYRFY